MRCPKPKEQLLATIRNANDVFMKLFGILFSEFDVIIRLKGLLALAFSPASTLIGGCGPNILINPRDPGEHVMPASFSRRRLTIDMSVYLIRS